MRESIRTLLSSLIDYAGLFPPAGLSMAGAVRNYSEYRRRSDAFALARFIVPVSRLAEFDREFEPFAEGPLWHISALLGGDAERDLAKVGEYNARTTRAVIDAVEVKVADAATVRQIGASVPAGIAAYLEISERNPQPLVNAVGAAGLRAKIRTGGVTPEAFPDAAHVVAFIRACDRAGVAFKATAGLHHPIRCVRPVTYEPDAVRGAMHGFVNVFLAAALMHEGLSDAEAASLLLEENPETFRIGDDFIRWREAEVAAHSLLKVRESFAIAFGSCSFEEPLADLRELGWIS